MRSLAVISMLVVIAGCAKDSPPAPAPVKEGSEGSAAARPADQVAAPDAPTPAPPYQAAAPADPVAAPKQASVDAAVASGDVTLDAEGLPLITCKELLAADEIAKACNVKVRTIKIEATKHRKNTCLTEIAVGGSLLQYNQVAWKKREWAAQAVTYNRGVEINVGGPAKLGKEVLRTTGEEHFVATAKGSKSMIVTIHQAKDGTLACDDAAITALATIAFGRL